MKLTKHGLLAAVAATALVAGAGAFAQQSGGQMEKQETTQPKSGAGTAQPQGKTQAQQPAPGGSQTQSGSGAEKKEMQGQTQKKTDAQPRGQVQDKDMKKEPGTAQQQPGAKQQPGQAQQPGGQKGEGTAQKDQPGGQKAAQDKSDAKSVQLTSEQRTKISTTIKQQTNLKRVSRSEVNFTINVGAVVPRTVNLVVLPAPIVAIVPQFRGYLYIVVDDQLLIIHPTTYEIVMVLPA